MGAFKPYEDPGNEGVKLGYADAEHDDGGWKTMDLPRVWESAGLNIDGSVWFRREVTIPTAWVGKELTLSLGALDDFDVTYVNGTEIGRTGLETPNSFAHPRVYKVPASVLQPGGMSSRCACSTNGAAVDLPGRTISFSLPVPIRKFHWRVIGNSRSSWNFHRHRWPRGYRRPLCTTP